MEAELQHLADRHLLPPPSTGGSCGLDLAAGVDYPAAYRGTLVGMAVGDALGRPAEGMTPASIQARFGELRDFQPWRGWRGGPKGTITDDTQMTICLARSLTRQGRLDPEDLARHFADWLDYGRGRGAACTEACLNLRMGNPWWEAGVRSAGNGAAMRASPIGLLHPRSPEGIRRDGALSAVITHADGMAVASAIAVGFLVAYLLHRPAGTLDPADLMTRLGSILADVPDPGHRERREQTDDRPVRLADRLAQVPDLLDLDRDEAFAYLHNGAFVLESLPAALWCFLTSPEDAEEAVVLAANGGHDADTVGAMTGAFSGAYLGEKAWPRRWVEDLEYAQELRGLGKGLLNIAQAAMSPRPMLPQACQSHTTWFGQGITLERTRIRGCQLLRIFSMYHSNVSTNPLKADSSASAFRGILRCRSTWAALRDTPGISFSRWASCLRSSGSSKTGLLVIIPNWSAMVPVVQIANVQCVVSPRSSCR